MKRINAVIAAVLACGMMCCAVTPLDEKKPVAETERPFDEPTEFGTDASMEIARAKELVFRIERGELSGTVARNAVLARREALRRTETDAAIAFVRYSRDVTDEMNKERYDRLYAQLYALRCCCIDAELLLLDDPELSDLYDAETKARLKRYDTLCDLSALPLIERERKLTSRYESLPYTLFTERNGRKWNGDEILSDPGLSDEEFELLYETYLTLFNREAGRIFTELVTVRRKLAETLGYGSYAAYRCACCGYGISPSEAGAFFEQIRVCFAPVLYGMRDAYEAASAKLCGAVFEKDAAMQRIGSVICMTVPELSEPWEYMRTYGMSDIESGPLRAPVDYAIRLDAYETPFLFVTWTNGYEMPPALIRTFGTFAALDRSEDAPFGQPPSAVAEIAARGLELMTVLRYDTIYGDLAPEASAAELTETVFSLLDACVRDAFLRYAYSADDLTVDALNAEYGRLCTAYGTDRFGAEARSWTQDPQLYLSPFRDAETAAGILTGLELYLDAAKDPKAASDAYRTILSCGDGMNASDACAAAGLRDPFSEETALRIASALERHLQKNGVWNDRQRTENEN